MNSFTSDPFVGNPAAVCLLEKEQDDLWMQKVA
ncbi:PhzF family phenazine biosynthesis protein [Fictibacillus enclensis]